jgi:hypothetical protein
MTIPPCGAWTVGGLRTRQPALKYYDAFEYFNHRPLATLYILLGDISHSHKENRVPRKWTTRGLDGSNNNFSNHSGAVDSSVSLKEDFARKLCTQNYGGHSVVCGDDICGVGETHSWNELEFKFGNKGGAQAHYCWALPHRTPPDIYRSDIRTFGNFYCGWKTQFVNFVCHYHHWNVFTIESRRPINEPSIFREVPRIF